MTTKKFCLALGATWTMIIGPSLGLCCEVDFQRITKATPRYQETENPSMRRVFLCPPITHLMSALPPIAAIRLLNYRLHLEQTA